MNEVVGFDAQHLFIAKKNDQEQPMFRLEHLDVSEIGSVEIKKVFLAHYIVIGPLLMCLGMGWLVGFFAGIIPIIFYIVAFGMIVFGFVMLFLCFENRAYFRTRDGLDFRATQISVEDREALESWCRSIGVIR